MRGTIVQAWLPLRLAARQEGSNRPAALRRDVRFFLVPTPGLRDVLPALRGALAAGAHEVVNDPEAPAPTPGLAQAERQAFLLAVDRMLEAEAVLADVSTDGAAAGWCASWFLAKGRLVVLTCRRDRRNALDPMLAGNPSPWQRLVLYDGPDDLAKSLGALLGAAR